MGRPIWKGSISFGLVTIPVTLHSAENRAEELHFTLRDSRDQARIRYKRVNENTGEEVAWEEIKKGYDAGDGKFVMLGDEDFKQAAVEKTQTIEIEDFVGRDEVDHVYFDKPYYLVPTKTSEHVYSLLREVLKRTNKIGIARVVLRTRQYLAAVVSEEGALVLNILRFHKEIVAPSELGLDEVAERGGKMKPQEIDMAERLVEAMTTKWKPEKYRDEYHKKLMAWIKKKIAKGQLEEAEPAPDVEEEDAPAPINIMELLKRSLPGKAAPGRRAAGGGHTRTASRGDGRVKKTTPRRKAS